MNTKISLLSRALSIFGIMFCSSITFASGPDLLPLKISSNGHYFETTNGKPFFWLGDTAWELIHSTTVDQAAYYLTVRSRQGYTVIQTVVLAEMDGITSPSPEGLTPFADNNPAKPNKAYFDKVAAIVAKANELGLYVALLPSWGDKMTAPWGAGPRLFPIEEPEVAKAYGKFLGERLKKHNNIIWMMGGDRPSHVDQNTEGYPKETAVKAGFPLPVDWRPVWTAMVEGIKSGYGRPALFSYHPDASPGGTAKSMQGVDWMSFNGSQSGHGEHDAPVWEAAQRDFVLNKPTLDLEPNYEDHPYHPWPSWDPATGHFDDYDVRKQSYRSVFAGAAGITYGHHSVWQFAGASDRDSVNHVLFNWSDALHRPGGNQMQFLRNLVESRPMISRIPDDSLILEGQSDAGGHLVGTRDSNGSYAFVYFPRFDQKAKIDLSKLKTGQIKAWWYNPRTGIGKEQGVYSSQEPVEFKSPPQGPDWVLVLDLVSSKFAPPGLR